MARANAGHMPERQTTMKALLDELLLSLAQLNDRFEARFFEGDFDESSARVDCDAAINSA
jgi:hypothetical protein